MNLIVDNGLYYRVVDLSKAEAIDVLKTHLVVVFPRWSLKIQFKEEQHLTEKETEALTLYLGAIKNHDGVIRLSEILKKFSEKGDKR